MEAGNYFANWSNAAITSPLCFAGETSSQTFAILPSGLMRKVLRVDILKPRMLVSEPYCFETAFPGVGGQFESEPLLCAEVLVAAGRIDADAYDDGVVFVVEGEIALEVVGFDGAAGGVVFRIEVEHHPLAFEIMQADAAAVLRRQGEIGRGLADLRDGVRGDGAGGDQKHAQQGFAHRLHYGFLCVAQGLVFTP